MGSGASKLWFLELFTLKIKVKGRLYLVSGTGCKLHKGHTLSLVYLSSFSGFLKQNQ